MGITDKKNKLTLYLSSLADSVVFSLLSTVLQYAFLYSFLGLGVEYLPQILVINIAVWLLIGLLGAEKVVQAIALVVALFIIALWYINGDTELFRETISDFAVWLMQSLPNEEIYTHEDFGVYFRATVHLAITIILLPFFDMKSFPKFALVLWIIVTGAFFGFSFIFFNRELTLFFISTLPLMYYISSRANYHKTAKHTETPTNYYFFQLKRFIASVVPSIILIFTVALLPIGFRSEGVVSFIDTSVNNVINSVEMFNRLSSRYYSLDGDSQALGGDLRQSGALHFWVRSEHPLLLRTFVYDEYTGTSFKRNAEETFVNFSSDISSHRDKNFKVSGSEYSIYMYNYNSRVLPLVSNHRDISEDTEMFTKDEYGVTYFNNYFIEDDEFTVSYDRVNYGLFEFFRYVRDNMPENGYIPPESAAPLPETVTQRTIDLANSIKEHAYSIVSFSDNQELSVRAKKAMNDYFVSLLMVSYLENNYSYSTLPGEQVGDDFVDSFLFELKKGYCTSFASALYVLLRSIDVPCRYVSGYSVQNPSVTEYTSVSDKNLHAWVEVYIQGFGYIPLDPTPSSYYAFANDTPSAQSNSYYNNENLLMYQDPNELAYLTEPYEDTYITDYSKEYSSDNNIWISVVLPVGLSIISVALAVWGGIVYYISYKKRVIDSVLTSTDVGVIYRNLINLLAVLNLKRKNNESVREFMLRVYEFYNPFHSGEEKYGRAKITAYSDFNIALSQEMESVITTIESYLYAKENTEKDVDDLLHFREEINNAVKRTLHPLIYLITFKNVK